VLSNLKFGKGGGSKFAGLGKREKSKGNLTSKTGGSEAKRVEANSIEVSIFDPERLACILGQIIPLEPIRMYYETPPLSWYLRERLADAVTSKSYPQDGCRWPVTNPVPRTSICVLGLPSSHLPPSGSFGDCTASDDRDGIPVRVTLNRT